MEKEDFYKTAAQYWKHEADKNHKIIADLLFDFQDKKKRIERLKRPVGKVKFVAGKLTNISGDSFYNQAISDILVILEGEKK